MQTRINISDVQDAFPALVATVNYVAESGLEQSLVDLIITRASQINRCAYCIDMHFKDALASGETLQRLYSLDAWRETPFYTDRERAALAWTEAVTLLSENGVPDELYEQVRQHFSDREIVDLTMTIIGINSWNRLNVSLQYNIPGHYKSQRKPESSLNAEPAK